jgi:hypothetical protein
MPATVTLSSTTLSVSVGPATDTLVLASTAGVLPGYRLYIDGELIKVNALAVDGVKVRRGVDGSAGAAHPSGSTVYIGRADQFYSQDPTGRPPDEIQVSPYINVVNGSVWYAQGDSLPLGNSTRWWQRQTTSYENGPMGVRTSTLNPTSST